MCGKIKYMLVVMAVILGTSLTTLSCRRSEEMDMTDKVSVSGGDKQLAKAMKKASLVMRRLARSVEGNDWPEMEMWTKELKEGIGFSCVEMYMIENNNISHEFTVLSNKFNTAINKLMLCSKRQDKENTALEFSNLVKSCDACHESFNEEAEALDFTDTGKE